MTEEEALAVVGRPKYEALFQDHEAVVDLMQRCVRDEAPAASKLAAKGAPADKSPFNADQTQGFLLGMVILATALGRQARLPESTPDAAQQQADEDDDLMAHFQAEIDAAAPRSDTHALHDEAQHALLRAVSRVADKVTDPWVLEALANAYLRIPDPDDGSTASYGDA